MTQPAEYESESANALAKSVAQAQDRYMRQVKAALGRLQSTADPADGFTPSPVLIREQADQTLRSIRHAYEGAHRAGCKLGRRHAYLDLDRLGIPRPAVPAIEYSEEDLLEAKAALEQKLTEAVEQLCMFMDPNQALGPVKRSAHAAVSTVLNTAYTQQQIATYKASAYFPPVESEREYQGEMFFFLFAPLIWLASAAMSLIASTISFALSVVSWTIDTMSDLMDMFGGSTLKFVWRADGISVAGTCDDCRRLDGERSDMWGEFSQSGWRGKGPPRHPNCQCRVELDYWSVKTLQYGWF